MHNLEQKTARIDTLCREARILPVITIDREADILPMADALAAGGLTALEITLRTTHGLTAIRRLSESARTCVSAPAPCSTRRPSPPRKGRGELRGHPGLHRRVAALRPGQRSPAVARRGQRFRDHARLPPWLPPLQLFPAEVSGGPAALKAFSGPFPDIRFCPTGGVSLNNLADYLAVPNVMCVGGTWMLPKAVVDRGDWAQVEAPQPRSPGALRRAPQTLRLPAWACPASAGFFMPSGLSGAWNG